MNLMPIVDYLETHSLGEEGKTIFINEMPAFCTQGILLLGKYHGDEIDHNLSDETSQYVRGGFRIAVRHTDYVDGEALAFAASKLLTFKGDRQIGSLLVKIMLPVTLPKPYRRTDGSYWEFEVEVNCNFIASTG